MADKLILNANLICKADRFTPREIVVEKVIKISDQEFKALIDKPLKDNYYLPAYKDLMGFYDDAYHGVLFVNKQSGDGLLVNSEGYNYARYSQFIPNARDIIQKHEQSLAIDDLKTHMDCCINNWLEQYKNETDICISLTEFINDSNLAEILADYVSVSLSNHPQIENCTIGNGFIEAEKRELTETKLYCPLTFRIEPEDSYDDLDEVDSANYIGYEREINAAVLADLYSDKDAVERGLAAYFHDENLDQKVLSAMPGVESRNGDIYGVITVKSYGELNKVEMIDLVNDLTGQLSDGFGEGFEQREVRLGDDNVYISFWDYDDDYFLKPESEAFPENKMDMTMGGLS